MKIVMYFMLIDFGFVIFVNRLFKFVFKGIVLKKIEKIEILDGKGGLECFL